MYIIIINSNNWFYIMFHFAVGEVFLNSGMCLDDALRIVRETVARKQEEVVWEKDI